MKAASLTPQHFSFFLAIVHLQSNDSNSASRQIHRDFECGLCLPYFSLIRESVELVSRTVRRLIAYVNQPTAQLMNLKCCRNC